MIRDGTKEIYVDYTIVAPIDVNIIVDGEIVATKQFEGSKGEVLNYSAFQTEVLTPYIGVMNGLRTEGSGVFGECTEVNVIVTTTNVTN